MTNSFLKQAKINLESCDTKNWRIKLAIKQIVKAQEIEKAEALADFVNSPSFHNIINLLGPLSNYYKIDQVLKLLKEMGSGLTKPQAPLYGVPQYVKEKWY